MEATFANCKRAIEQWWSAASNMPVQAAQKSRSVFFFSGHGFQFKPRQSLLLPSDFLRPAVGAPTNEPQRAAAMGEAILLEGLTWAMRCVPIGTQLFFADACRSMPDALKADISGDPMLTQPPPSDARDEVEAGIIFAAAMPGEYAYQPARGMSVFGQALLEGLRGTSPVTLDCATPRPTHCAIKADALGGFLKARMPEILRDAGSNHTQKVSPLWDPPKDVGITDIGRAGLTGNRGPLDPEDSALAASSVAFEEARFEEFHVAGILPVSTRSTIAIAAPGLARLLDGVSFVGAGSDTPNAVEIEAFQRAPGGTFRVSVRPNIGLGQNPLVQLRDGDTTWYLWSTPDGQNGPVSYRLTLRLDTSSHISDFECDLSPENHDAAGDVAKLWDTFTFGNTAALSKEFQGGHLSEFLQMEDYVRYKLESPLSATLAAGMLLRAGRTDLLNDWLRNLTNWFPDNPDAPVLWAEQLRLERRPAAEVMEALSAASGRGIPHTAVGFEAASVLVDRYGPANFEGRSEALFRWKERIEVARNYVRPGGAFTVLAAPAAVDIPGLAG